MPEIGRNTFSYIRMRAGGVIEWLEAPLAASFLLNMRVAGDINPRFRIRADGTIQWGAGNIAPDCEIIRSNPNMLQTTDTLEFNAGYIYLSGLAAAALQLYARATGDTQNSFGITNRGLISWGPGNAALDCELSRNAANELRTPDQLTVQGGVATLIKAGVPGDGDFATAIDGLLAVDTAANKLYIRSSGGWVLVGP